jgi:hypothetical protein
MSIIANKPAPARRRLRFEPPTLEEAIFAAQGLTDSLDGQTEIAASLMGLPEADVRDAVLKAAAPTGRYASRASAPPRTGAGRPVVVVERRGARTLMR